MSTHPLSKTKSSSDLVHYFWDGPQIHVNKILNNKIKNVILGRANARTESSQPAASPRAYQSNSFINFHNSLFFVIVRPKNVRRNVSACKTLEQIL